MRAKPPAAQEQVLRMGSGWHNPLSTTWCADLYLEFQDLDGSSLYCEVRRQAFQLASVPDCPLTPLSHFPLGVSVFTSVRVDPMASVVWCFPRNPDAGVRLSQAM